MAATTLTVTTIDRDGVDETLTAATVTEGDEFANSGQEHVVIDNASGGAINVTFRTTFTRDGLALADRVESVGAGERKKFGTFDTATYGDTVLITCDSVTSVTLGVFKSVKS